MVDTYAYAKAAEVIRLGEMARMLVNEASISLTFVHGGVSVELYSAGPVTSSPLDCRKVHRLDATVTEGDSRISLIGYYPMLQVYKELFDRLPEEIVAKMAPDRWAEKYAGRLNKKMLRAYMLMARNGIYSMEI